MHDNLNSTSLDDYLSAIPEVTAEHAEHTTTKDQGRTAPPTIKTWAPSKQPEVPAKIRTVSPVLAKAQNAKKGFSAPAGKRTQATYPLQKPPKSKFVRVHPSPEYHLAGVRTLTDRDTGEIKYVDPDLDLPGFIDAQTRITDLYAAHMSDGSFFIWPSHRSDTSWFRAAKRAIQTAMGQWVAVVARRAANTYDLITPEDPIPEPDWAVLPPFAEMVESAFEDHMITHVDHPFLRKLRGVRRDDDE